MTFFDKILTQKSVRITPMRQLLLEYLVQEQKPFGLTELEKSFPKADRTTIYRTLKTFEEKGIVHSINNGLAEVKYALCHEDCSEQEHSDLHPHFHCLKCQETTCLESVFIPTISLPVGFDAKEVSMTVKGICKTCQSG